jgi:hypothetical protein
MNLQYDLVIEKNIRANAPRKARYLSSNLCIK